MSLQYLWGFGNEHSTEAVAGGLPTDQNSPQAPSHGLYAEQLSATAFTSPRHDNRRTWAYRVRPSAAHSAFDPMPERPYLCAAPINERLEPNRIRWNPLEFPAEPTDFIDGLLTMGANGDVRTHTGMAVHLYAATLSMTRVFADNDGELLLVPQEGSVHIDTELGQLLIAPGEIATIPRGMRFRVGLPEGRARGYVCENYGRLFTLPELGLIGANGLASPRHFRSPTAWFDEANLDMTTTLVTKLDGHLWQTDLDHSPFDVVAWHGSNVPYAYDLALFNTINTVSFDHPDPSIFTVLTSPSENTGTANVDFVIFPPRWMVAEHTFRPPWFHRNVMSEFLGLVHGVYDAKADGFAPGGSSLHNSMTAHGPDAATFEKASTVALTPHKIDSTLAFMFETRWPIVPTKFAATGPLRQPEYDSAWKSLNRQFPR
jgi:homogentisate 1,2-dioxygenase